MIVDARTGRKAEYRTPGFWYDEDGNPLLCQLCYPWACINGIHSEFWYHNYWTEREILTMADKKINKDEEKVDPNMPPADEGADPTSDTADHGDQVKRTTGTPTEEHPLAMRASPKTKDAQASNDIQFRILHSKVGSFDQGQIVTQDDLKVDDRGLDRLFELEAIEVVMPSRIPSDKE
jgi:hypothetical protein